MTLQHREQSLGRYMSSAGAERTMRAALGRRTALAASAESGQRVNRRRRAPRFDQRTSNLAARLLGYAMVWLRNREHGTLVLQVVDSAECQQPEYDDHVANYRVSADVAHLCPWSRVESSR
jgi:hypothetical protein